MNGQRGTGQKEWALGPFVYSAPQPRQSEKEEENNDRMGGTIFRTSKYSDNAIQPERLRNYLILFEIQKMCSAGTRLVGTAGRNVVKRKTCYRNLSNDAPNQTFFSASRGCRSRTSHKALASCVSRLSPIRTRSNSRCGDTGSRSPALCRVVDSTSIRSNSTGDPTTPMGAPRNGANQIKFSTSVWGHLFFFVVSARFSWQSLWRGRFGEGFCLQRRGRGWLPAIAKKRKAP
jgi:hypothetical protein